VLRNVAIIRSNDVVGNNIVASRRDTVHHLFIVVGDLCDDFRLACGTI
jgi:hypothetical protein